MLVVSSALLTDGVRASLINDFPDQTFEFYRSIDEASDRYPYIEILITYGEDLTPFHIRQMSKLKWIMVISAGMDLMPFAEIKERNILVTNAKGIHKIPMAEYAISMFLHLYHKQPIFYENQKKQAWNRNILVNEITGKTMTIVGTGEIGQELARIAKAFQIKTIGVSRNGEPKDYFDEVYPVDELITTLKHADFIVSILPSTNETKYLFQLAHFKAMPSHSIFLNMGRGDVVSSDVLLSALNTNQIAHAVLDVFETEPLPKGHPFWTHEKVTMTPHKSSHSPMYIPRAITIFRENLKKYSKGSSNFINEIDIDRGY
ncbi:D-2-hydroxyacid dehydrogenase [Aquibacillus salsiterrae]|uniref:D-2-hydroxyacid dehydrogenase n=1 Tax=Aquibacillus salsiterrae TaxID=2950439 RepID=A0A9X3WE70_9BACI|nr:D-2-hydroxyacid dehydrogenase [Aquibacillus salsiterrae]MDC3418217.1 D-2-hydroxyacid dehydrogenase [Aquibacillus salsiterrae]